MPVLNSISKYCHQNKEKLVPIAHSCHVRRSRLRTTFNRVLRISHGVWTRVHPSNRVFNCVLVVGRRSDFADHDHPITIITNYEFDDSLFVTGRYLIKLLYSSIKRVDSSRLECILLAHFSTFDISISRNMQLISLFQFIQRNLITSHLSR